MKKIILASVSGLALMGLAACSDTDGTTTEGIDSGAPATTDAPAAAPTTPPAGGTDTGTGTGMAPAE